MIGPVGRIDIKSKTQGRQVVSFLVNETYYAIDISKISEIISFKEATPLPQAPSSIEGVLDLRGTVVPILDLKKKIGMNSSVSTPSSHIVIVKLPDHLLGIIVDEVKEVLHLSEDQIQVPQKMYQEAGSRYLAGICKVGERLVFLLDIDGLFKNDEQTWLGEIQR